MELLLQAEPDVNIASHLSGIVSDKYSYTECTEDIKTLLKFVNDKNLPNTELQKILKRASENSKLETFKVLIIYSVENYISKLKQHDSNHREKFLFLKTGYTAGEKIAAANALLEVIRDGRSLATIQSFEDVLNHGELGKIYTIVLPKINLFAKSESSNDYSMQ